MPLKLRYVGISSIEALPESPQWDGRFFTRSRTMCNYIYRNFSAHDLETISPSSFVIWMHHSPRDHVYEINGSHFADIPARVEDAEVFMAEDVGTPDFYSFLYELLAEGLIKLEAQVGFPRDQILEVAQNFLEGGCKNVWTMASKSPRGLGVKGVFEAQMTAEQFEISFILFEGDVELHRESVFRSEPSETSWYRHRVRNLSYKNGHFYLDSRWSYKLP